MPNRLLAYYQLVKPGIIRGNVIHVVAGSLFSSAITLDCITIIGVVIGTSLVIASACVANNYMDRGIDARMTRTKRRPSVTGDIPFSHAFMFLLLLLVLGIAVLAVTTNIYVILSGLLAYILYVFAYGWAKRKTIHSTLVGALPGALPVAAGYIAISGQVTLGAALLFLLVVTWQMPHFYAISLFRKKEYQSARLPVMGAVKPFEYVRNIMIAYVLVYLGLITLLIATKTIVPSAGLLLLSGGALWMYVCCKRTNDHEAWARSVFGISLVLALGLLAASALNFFVATLA